MKRGRLAECAEDSSPRRYLGGRKGSHSNLSLFDIAKQKASRGLSEYLETETSDWGSTRSVFRVEFGFPSGVIAMTAAEGKFDLVVMGARGSGEFDALRLGRTAETVSCLDGPRPHPPFARSIEGAR